MQIALITGGSRGLGKDMAHRLAAKGIAVVITYKERQADAEAVVKAIHDAGGKSACLRFDAGDVAGLEDFVRRFADTLRREWSADRFDFLINNAGMGATVPFPSVTEQLFDDFLNVHFKSVYFLTQRCLPLLRDGGAVINISSGSTRFCVPGYSAYASMKGAVEVLTKYLAKELGPRRIRVNIVAPGPIETDFNNAAIRNTPPMKAALTGMTPLGRVGNTEDIGTVIAFLCSEDARWINGQRIEVSGGINA